MKKKFRSLFGTRSQNPGKEEYSEDKTPEQVSEGYGDDLYYDDQIPEQQHLGSRTLKTSYLDDEEESVQKKETEVRFVNYGIVGFSEEDDLSTKQKEKPIWRSDFVIVDPAGSAFDGTKQRDLSGGGASREIYKLKDCKGNAISQLRPTKTDENGNESLVTDIKCGDAVWNNKYVSYDESHDPYYPVTKKGDVAGVIHAVGPNYQKIKDEGLFESSLVKTMKSIFVQYAKNIDGITNDRLAIDRPGLRIPLISGDLFKGDLTDKKYHDIFLRAIHNGYIHACSELRVSGIDFGDYGLQICCYRESEYLAFKDVKLVLRYDIEIFDSKQQNDSYRTKPTQDNPQAKSSKSQTLPPQPQLFPSQPHPKPQISSELAVVPVNDELKKKETLEFLYQLQSNEDVAERANLLELAITRSGCKLELGLQHDAAEAAIPLMDTLFGTPFLQKSTLRPHSNVDLYLEKTPSQDPQGIMITRRGNDDIKGLFDESLSKVEVLQGSEAVYFQRKDGSGASEDFRIPAKKTIHTILGKEGVQNPEVEEFVLYDTRYSTRKTPKGEIAPFKDTAERKFPDVKVGSKNFSPTAFVCHKNGKSDSAGSGHYIAYIKANIEGREVWFVCNDSETKEVNYQDVINDAKSNSVLVKYGTVDARLPNKAPIGIQNIGNTCWANALGAFVLSMHSLQKLFKSQCLDEQGRSVPNPELGPKAPSKPPVQTQSLPKSANTNTNTNPYPSTQLPQFPTSKPKATSPLSNPTEQTAKPAKKIDSQNLNQNPKAPASTSRVTPPDSTSSADAKNSPSTKPRQEITATRAQDQQEQTDMEEKLVKWVEGGTTNDPDLDNQIQKSIAAQNEKPNPTGAYNGIGVNIAGQPFPKINGKYVLQIESIFAPESARFSSGGSAKFNPEETKSMVGQCIISVMVNGQEVSIDELIKQDLTLKTIAKIFHDPNGNIEFTIQDSNDKQQIISCERSPNNCFVTQNCQSAQKVLSEERKQGDAYDPKKHGCEALIGEQNLKTTRKAIAR